MVRQKKSPNGMAYETVTRGLIAELERGDVPPWIQPWNGATGMPMSLASGRSYSGINVLSLWSATSAYGFGSRWWLTFRQARELGGHVRRGERGTSVLAFSIRDVDEIDESGTETRRLAFARNFRVFNAEQCEGITIPDEPSPPTEVERDAQIDGFVAATGATVVHRGTRALYRPRADRIEMPQPGRFRDRGSYYATLLHELVHWAGHPDRLARERGTRFGDDAYAREELVAELGAALLCAEFGVPGQLQHAAYLGHWVAQLKADARLLVRSAAAAQRAVDYLRRVVAPESAQSAS